MALVMPSYIQRAKILDTPIRYAWDAKSFYKFLGDERLANRIAKISLKGIAGLSAGFAEWVAWRLDSHFQDPILLNYVEAVWAGVIDWRYLRERTSVQGAPYYLKDWQGVVRGPVIATFNEVDEILLGVKQTMGVDMSCSCFAQLTEYVMPDKKPFKDWRRFAIGRLSQLYPYNRKDPFGPAIPREILDPDIDYKPEMAGAFLANFLQRLDPKQNPFLHSSEEMIADGFEGTPYTL